MIIDNADESERDYAQYIPSGMSGDVLFTTRVPECKEYNTVGSEKLEDLEPELALELLYRAADIAESQWKEKKEAAMAIVKILGLHTLAIIQAGAFIKKGLCSLEQYPIVFKQQQGKLLKFHAKQNLSTYGNVYATFEVSAEYLQKSALPEASDALDLLHIIAFMHSSGISETMFQRASKYASALRDSEPDEDKEGLSLSARHTARLPDYVQGWTGVQDRIRWREACTVLENLSIITVNKNDDCFAISVHSLIHAWAKTRQERQSQCRAWQAAATIVALSCEGYWGYQPFFTAVHAHVRACVNPEIEDYTRTLSDMEAAQIYFQLAYVLYQMRDDRSLHPFIERIRLRLQDRFENDHKVAIEIKTFTGRIYIAQEKHSEAVAVFQDIMETRSRVLPDDDALRLELQHELAVAYRNIGQVDKAVQLFEHVVKVRERLPPNHPDKLVSQHELASAYREDGQIEKAIQLFEHVVKIKETSLAEDHPIRLISQHELACVYLEDGQIEKAIQLFEHVVKIQKTSLIEDHPSRLSSQHELARVYRVNGQIAEAIQLFEHVVKIRETSSAEDHPSRLASQYELAICYLDIGQFTKAIALLEHVVDVRKTSLAEDDPKRLDSQCWLAKCYSNMGEYTKAIALFEHVVDIRKTSLAEDNPSQLASQYTLALCYSDIGQFTKAIALLEHVISVQKRSLAEDHPAQLASQYTLALCYSNIGQFTKAIALLEHVVGVEKTSLAEDNPSRLASQHLLAICYSDIEQFTKAIALLEHVVGVEKMSLAEDDPKLLNSQHLLALCYSDVRQFTKAIALLEHVVGVEKTSLAEDRPAQLISRDALADVYRKNGQLDEALRVEGMSNSDA